jgi:hypothetical protein
MEHQDRPIHGRTAFDYADINAKVTVTIKTNSKWIDPRHPNSTFSQERKNCLT